MKKFHFFFFFLNTILYLGLFYNICLSCFKGLSINHWQLRIFSVTLNLFTSPIIGNLNCIFNCPNLSQSNMDKIFCFNFLKVIMCTIREFWFCERKNIIYIWLQMFTYVYCSFSVHYILQTWSSMKTVEKMNVIRFVTLQLWVRYIGSLCIKVKGPRSFTISGWTTTGNRFKTRVRKAYETNGEHLVVSLSYTMCSISSRSA